VWESVRGLKQPLFLVVNSRSGDFPKEKKKNAAVPRGDGRARYESGIVPVSASHPDNLSGWSTGRFRVYAVSPRLREEC